MRSNSLSGISDFETDGILAWLSLRPFVFRPTSDFFRLMNDLSFPLALFAFIQQFPKNVYQIYLIWRLPESISFRHSSAPIWNVSRHIPKQIG